MCSSGFRVSGPQVPGVGGGRGQTYTETFLRQVGIWVQNFIKIGARGWISICPSHTNRRTSKHLYTHFYICRYQPSFYFLQVTKINVAVFELDLECWVEKTSVSMSQLKRQGVSSMNHYKEIPLDTILHFGMSSGSIQSGAMRKITGKNVQNSSHHFEFLCKKDFITF